MPDRLDEISQALSAFDEEQLQSLRQAGRNDPLPGLPLRHQVGRDPNEVAMIDCGKWIDEGWADERGMPPSCPVVPLGKDGQTSWFFDTLQQIVPLDAKSSGKGPIGSLFAGRSRYLEWAWPRWSQPRTKIVSEEDGSKSEVVVKPSAVIGWQADDARQCLVDACAYVGLFEFADQVRGAGAWRHEDGSLIYHAGNEVWIEGHWRAPGHYGPHIYPRRPKIGRPIARSQKAGPDSAGEQLFNVLKTFNWDREDLDARLVLGWLMTAKIGGALRRRPVLFVHGGEGSGKSTLQDLLRAVMCGALIQTSDSTQAGVYHKLQQDSLAILVDELEAKDDSRAVDKILALARIAYSGDKMLRGSKEGMGKEFTLMSSFMGSAVSKPATEAQDDSRMALVMLRERVAAGARLEIDPKWADIVGRHLLRRAFDWWPKWDELVAIIRSALIEVGHNDRSADTFAPLAAGFHIALYDEMPEPGELTDTWQVWLHASTLDEINNRERTWHRCLMQLLKSSPTQWREYSAKTPIALLEELQERTVTWELVDSRMQQIGLALSVGAEERDGAWVDDPKDWAHTRLFVPSNHPGVRALFEETSWAGRLGQPGPWCNVLRQAPRELWENGKSQKGLDRKASGIYIHLARALGA